MLNEPLIRSPHHADDMGRNAMTYQGHNSDRPEPQHDLPRDQPRPLPLKRAEDRAVNQDATATPLLRPRSVRKLVELLRPLPVRERTTILAQAIHEGTMTRVGADQVLFALAFGGKPGDTCSIAPCSRRQAQRNTSAILNQLFAANA